MKPTDKLKLALEIGYACVNLGKGWFLTCGDIPGTIDVEDATVIRFCHDGPGVYQEHFNYLEVTL